MTRCVHLNFGFIVTHVRYARSGFVGGLHIKLEYISPQKDDYAYLHWVLRLAAYQLLSRWWNGLVLVRVKVQSVPTVKTY